MEEALKRMKEGTELLKREEETDELVHKWIKEKQIGRGEGNTT